MQHIFNAGTEGTKRTLVLLHGTGGDEHDLLPIGKMIDPDANVLSIRGNVKENGMNRFFRRLAEGVFDEEDLIFRTKELDEFLDEAAEKYQLERSLFTAVGYSNGANIAASLFYHFERPLKGAVLLHPMVPRRGIELPNMEGTPIFIGAGENDPICPPEETKELAKNLIDSSADVDLNWFQAGHQLTQEEVTKASEWYKLKIK